jgi:hypothetical protein
VAEIVPGEDEGTTIATRHPMIVFDSGQGPELIVGGGFFTMNGLPAKFVARWNGHSWRAMGVGPREPFAFCAYDDGTGPSLYMGYDGDDQPGVVREGVARWNGTDWVSVGGGVAWVSAGNAPGGVRAMAVFDDGSGPALFVTGTFDHAGGLPAKQIAKWDGHSWSALGAGIGGFPQNLAVANDGRGDSLFVQGGLSSAGGGSIFDIAQWVGCRGQCYPNCDNSTASPRLNVNDFMCFLNKWVTKDPYANCDVDAQINIADFQCFLNKFAAGCQ